MPSNRTIGEQAVWRVFSNLASHASNDLGLVWVSDRTQEAETGLNRRSVRAARTLLEQQGTLIDTYSRKQKGVKVFQLVIPGFDFGSGLVITPTEQRSSGQVSGQVSGHASGQVSGQASGLVITPQTEQNLNKTQAEVEALLQLVVDRQLAHETWRTNTTKEKYKEKVRTQFQPVCEKALLQFPGGQHDTDLANWVLGELFVKEKPEYKVSPATLLALTQKYGLPGGDQNPCEAPMTYEASAAEARKAKQVFMKVCEQNRQVL